MRNPEPCLAAHRGHAAVPHLSEVALCPGPITLRPGRPETVHQDPGEPGVGEPMPGLQGCHASLAHLPQVGRDHPPAHCEGAETLSRSTPELSCRDPRAGPAAFWFKESRRGPSDPISQMADAWLAAAPLPLSLFPLSAPTPASRLRGGRTDVASGRLGGRSSRRAGDLV